MIDANVIPIIEQAESRTIKCPHEPAMYTTIRCLWSGVERKYEPARGVANIKGKVSGQITFGLQAPEGEHDDEREDGKRVERAGLDYDGHHGAEAVDAEDDEACA